MRRAWIEIVDIGRWSFVRLASLSVRRAWIEIFSANFARSWDAVALREESVD